jgi:hypothetical protein
MILTTSVELSDRPSPNCHLSLSIEKRDPGRQEGAAAEKAVPFSTPLFDDKPLLASHRRHRTWLENAKKNVRTRSASQAEGESSVTKGGSK